MFYVIFCFFILGFVLGALLVKHKPKSNNKNITKINPIKQKKFWGYEKNLSEEVKLLYLTKETQSAIFNSKNQLTLYVVSGEIVLVSNPFKETIRAGETLKIPANTNFSLYAFYSTHIIFASNNVFEIIQTLNVGKPIKLK